MKFFLRSVLLSYGQIFFSYRPWFSALLLVVTFFNWQVGLGGLMGVIIANVTAIHLKYNRDHIGNGYYGFNALLVALEVSYFFQPNFACVLLLLVMIIATVLLTAVLNNIFRTHLGIPTMSLPFVIISILLYFSTYNYTGLVLRSSNGAGGGNSFIWEPIWLYFQALGIIFFQSEVFAGIILALILVAYSRILAFLSLSGFLVGMGFYHLMGGSLIGPENAFIGFNFIFTAIAIGGMLFVPSMSSYILAMVATMLTALIASGIKTFVIFYGMPVFALPFNLIVFLLLLAYKQRGVDNHPKLVDFVPGCPEENLNYYLKNIKRFGAYAPSEHLHIPVKGKWKISQGVDGEHTHKDDWKWALDLQKLAYDGNIFVGQGNELQDYPTYNASVYAPIAGTVVAIESNVEDNEIGQINTVQNWGNYVLLYVAYGIYVKLAHLAKESICVALNQQVKLGDLLGKVGNSGRSAYPHLHIQIQSLPIVGAPTLRFKFDHYILHSEKKSELKISSLPKKNDIVEACPKDSGFAACLTLHMNRSFQFTKNGSPERVKTVVDFYGRTYLESEKKARLYFSKNLHFFYFLDFAGNKNSVLYDFYQSIPRIPLCHRKDMYWKEQIYYPNKGIIKIIEDFLYFLLPARTQKRLLRFSQKARFQEQICYSIKEGENAQILLHPQYFLMKLTRKNVVVEQTIEKSVEK